MSQGNQTPNSQGNVNFQPSSSIFKTWTWKIALGNDPPAEASVSFCFSAWLVYLILNTAGFCGALQHTG